MQHVQREREHCAVCLWLPSICTYSQAHTLTALSNILFGFGDIDITARPPPRLFLVLTSQYPWWIGMELNNPWIDFFLIFLPGWVRNNASQDTGRKKKEKGGFSRFLINAWPIVTVDIRPPIFSVYLCYFFFTCLCIVVVGCAIFTGCVLLESNILASAAVFFLPGYRR